ncbi:MAG: hemin uptake protein HemP [Gemmatales bacterium]
MNQMKPPVNSDVDQQATRPLTASVMVVQSATLFHGQREVWIEHEGERYRLRITRRGKLILQK